MGYHSLAVVTSVKFECDSGEMEGIFAKSKISLGLVEKLMNAAVVPPPLYFSSACFSIELYVAHVPAINLVLCATLGTGSWLDKDIAS